MKNPLCLSVTKKSGQNVLQKLLRNQRRLPGSPFVSPQTPALNLTSTLSWWRATCTRLQMTCLTPDPEPLCLQTVSTCAGRTPPASRQTSKQAFAFFSHQMLTNIQVRKIFVFLSWGYPRSGGGVDRSFAIFSPKHCFLPAAQRLGLIEVWVQQVQVQKTSPFSLLWGLVWWNFQHLELRHSFIYMKLEK